MNKGVPRKFIQEVHLGVLERVHHTMHHEDQEDINVVEFPLESSNMLKKALIYAQTPNEKTVLKFLDQKPAQAEELCQNIPELSHDQIDEVLSTLQEKNLVKYEIDTDVWRISDNETISS